MNTFLFFCYGNRLLIFFLLLFSKRVQILKTGYKYGQYCNPLSQSDCRLFFRVSDKVEYLQNELKSLIEGNTERHYLRISKRLTNPFTSTKTCWSILNHFSTIKRFPASCHCFIKIGTLRSIKIRLNYSITFLVTNVL